MSVWMHVHCRPCNAQRFSLACIPSSFSSGRLWIHHNLTKIKLQYCTSWTSCTCNNKSSWIYSMIFAFQWHYFATGRHTYLALCLLVLSLSSVSLSVPPVTGFLNEQWNSCMQTGYNLTKRILTQLPVCLFYALSIVHKLISPKNCLICKTYFQDFFKDFCPVYTNPRRLFSINLQDFLKVV